jgi:hypothetical protein
MHSVCAIVEGRNVNWGYGERICTAVENAHVRRSYLQDFRIEMESQTALNLLSGEALLISEPKIGFAVPIRVTHYREYLERSRRPDYDVPETQRLSSKEKQLRELKTQKKPSLE